MTFFFLFSASAISAHIENASKNLFNTLSSLPIPTELNGKIPQSNARDRRMASNATPLSSQIDISVLVLMHIVSVSKQLKELLTNKKVHFILIKFTYYFLICKFKCKSWQSSTTENDNSSLYSALFMPCLNR